MSIVVAYIAGFVIGVGLCGPLLTWLGRELRAAKDRNQRLNDLLVEAYREHGRLHAWYRNPHPLKSAVRWMTPAEFAALTGERQ